MQPSGQSFPPGIGHKNSDFRNYIPTSNYIWNGVDAYPKFLPQSTDFYLSPYPYSTRLCRVSYGLDGFWYFENYRCEIYCRSAIGPAVWYFCLPYSKFVKLSLYSSNYIQTTYGMFMGQEFDDIPDVPRHNNISYLQNGVSVPQEVTNLSPAINGDIYSQDHVGSHSTLEPEAIDDLVKTFGQLSFNRDNEESNHSTERPKNSSSTSENELPCHPRPALVGLSLYADSTLKLDSRDDINSDRIAKKPDESVLNSNASSDLFDKDYKRSLCTDNYGDLTKPSLTSHQAFIDLIKLDPVTDSGLSTTEEDDDGMVTEPNHKHSSPTGNDCACLQSDTANLAEEKIEGESVAERETIGLSTIGEHAKPNHTRSPPTGNQCSHLPSVTTNLPEGNIKRESVTDSEYLGFSTASEEDGGMVAKPNNKRSSPTENDCANLQSATAHIAEGKIKDESGLSTIGECSKPNHKRSSPTGNQCSHLQSATVNFAGGNKKNKCVADTDILGLSATGEGQGELVTEHKQAESIKRMAVNSKVSYAEVASGTKNRDNNLQSKKETWLASKVKSVVEFTMQTSKKVFSKLQNFHEEKYRTETSWKDKLPLYENPRYISEWSPYDLDIIYKDQRSKAKIMHNIFESSSPYGCRILISGGRGFGKTTLCHLLAYRWVTEDNEMHRRFDLCLKFHLNELNFGNDLDEAVLTICTMRLGKMEVKKEMMEKVLTENSSKTLIILDGLLEMPENLMKVNNFLRSSRIFSKTTIVVTSEPGIKNFFSQLFHQHVFIKGVTLERLKNLAHFEHHIKRINFPSTIMQNISCNPMIDYLCELASFFTTYILKAFAETAKSVNSSLFDILDVAMYKLFSRYFPQHDIENAFQKLGQFFFEVLEKGYYTFDGNMLQKIFGPSFRILIQCQIFYQKRDTPANETLWVVSSRLLLVFFVTRYLRNLYLLVKDDEQLREAFIQKFLCPGGCIGDFVVNDSCVYFVGLFPEIVLKLKDKVTFENAVIEMCYDTDRIEHSNAFESVSLLARISDIHLKRFFFKKCADNDESLQESFSTVINALSFDDLTVDTAYYHNIYENTYFLRVVCSEGESSILQAVFRMNSSGFFNRTLIRFLCSKFNSVFNFLQAFLNQPHKIELNDSCKNMTYHEFAFALTKSFLSCETPCPVLISCGGSNLNSSEDFSRTMSLQITINPTTKERKVNVRTRDSSQRLQCSEDLYSKQEFFNSTHKIQEALSGAFQFSNFPTISVDIL